MHENAWVSLVDEPIGDLIARVQNEDPEIAALVASPQRQLAFRTFASLRVGVLLGELLIDTNLVPDGSATWVEELLADPDNRTLVAEQVKGVAREVAADPEFADEELGPEVEARERFRRFAKRALGD